MTAFKILLVDDDPDHSKAICHDLSLGATDTYEVHEARSLEETKKILEDTRVDVILFELTLPDSQGLETAKVIRKLAPDVATIVITNEKETNLAQEVQRLGCQDFLVKNSFKGDLLRHSIRYAYQRNHLEFELKNSQRRFRDYAEAGADWFWEMGPDLTFTFLSDSFEENTGIEREDYLGKSLPVIAGGFEKSSSWGPCLKMMHDHKPFRELEYIAATEQGGGTQWFRLNGRPIFDDNDTFLGYRGNGTDISIERYNEEQASRNKHIIEGVLSPSMEGFLVLSAVRNVYNKIADFTFTHINRRAEEILKRNRNELLGRLFKSEMPHLVDHGIFDRCVQAVDNGASFNIEQLYNERGVQGWLRIIGVKMGEGVVVTIADVSAHKEAGREQRLAAALFRTSAEGMMITDSNNKIVSANPAFTKISGYAYEEVMGKDPSILSSNHHPKAFFEKLWTHLNAKGHWIGDIWNRRKDGEIYVQRMTISVIKNEKNKVENYVAVFNDRTEERERENKLYNRAHYDALTSLPNRTLLEDRINLAIPKAMRAKNKFAILFIDLDGFKFLNDTFGHLAGDYALQEAARRFKGCVRESDTIARLGGDEFVALCHDVSEENDVKVIAQHMLDSLEDPFVFEEQNMTLGASVGIALFPEHGNKNVRLLKCADAAMYRSKQAGKGQFKIYDGG